MSKKLKLEPMGAQLLVVDVAEETFNKLEGGTMFIANTQLRTVKVVEVSKEFKDIYNVDDLLLVPKDCGTSQPYKATPHWWINANGAPLGHVWAKLVDDIATKKNED